MPFRFCMCAGFYLFFPVNKKNFPFLSRLFFYHRQQIVMYKKASLGPTAHFLRLGRKFESQSTFVSKFHIHIGPSGQFFFVALVSLAKYVRLNNHNHIGPSGQFFFVALVSLAKYVRFVAHISDWPFGPIFFVVPVSLVKVGCLCCFLTGAQHKRSVETFWKNFLGLSASPYPCRPSFFQKLLVHRKKGGLIRLAVRPGCYINDS